MKGCSISAREKREGEVLDVRSPLQAQHSRNQIIEEQQDESCTIWDVIVKYEFALAGDVASSGHEC